MINTSKLFKATPREEEILGRCVDYEQYREELDKLEARIKQLEKQVKGGGTPQ